MIHLAKYDLNELPNVSQDLVIIAWCGERATIKEDGYPDPPEFDFVTKNWPDKADCQECLDEHSRN